MTERATTAKDSFTLVINSDQSFTEAGQRLRKAYAEHKHLTLSVRPGLDRSAEQNRLWQAMYKRIAQSTEQGEPKEIWAYCKLMMGVPILRRDDERFAAGWDRYFAERPFSEMLFLMGANPLFGPDGFPVTRLFGTKQGVEYTEAILEYYEPKGVNFDDLMQG